MNRFEQRCKRIVIVCRGYSEHDLEMALDEAVRGVKTGCWTGHNSNDTGAYYFDVTTDVPAEEQPA